MDSLYLLQFGCFLFMLINAAYLVLGSLHTQWQNKRYEHSRNLIVVALAILAFQYYLQMSLGLRATDDAYGALLNVLVYPLSFSLISIAIYHIEATHSRRRKMNLVCIGFYVAICLVCGIGYLQRGQCPFGSVALCGASSVLGERGVWRGDDYDRDAEASQEAGVDGCHRPFALREIFQGEPLHPLYGSPRDAYRHHFHPVAAHRRTIGAYCAVLLHRHLYGIGQQLCAKR